MYFHFTDSMHPVEEIHLETIFIEARNDNMDTLDIASHHGSPYYDVIQFQNQPNNHGV